MEGGQSRDFVVLRVALAVVCAALMALVTAPFAFAGAPASDQYGSALPGVGGGGGSGSPSGSSSGGGGGEATIPVAGDDSSPDTGGTVSSAGSGGTGTASNATSNGGSSHRSDQSKSAGKGGDKSGDNGESSLSSNPASHSVPQIAADSAGNSWLPFFIGGMLALACAAAALIYRNRRRTAQG